MRGAVSTLGEQEVQTQKRYSGFTSGKILVLTQNKVGKSSWLHRISIGHAGGEKNACAIFAEGWGLDETNPK